MKLLSRRDDDLKVPDTLRHIASHNTADRLASHPRGHFVPLAAALSLVSFPERMACLTSPSPFAGQVSVDSASRALPVARAFFLCVSSLSLCSLWPEMISCE